MNVLLIENLAILLCAAIGFVFGAFRYLRPRKPLYASMIVLGLGCILLGRLFQCVWLWTGGSLTDHFQVGILGAAGAFSFFFSANFGQVDSLVDDGGKCFRRWRIAAWSGPLVIAALYAVILLTPAKKEIKAAYGFTAYIIALASYFHVKHLFIPDVDYGVVRCQRAYNGLALIMGIASMLEMIAMVRNRETIIMAAGAALCVLSLALVPAMDRGVKKWTA